MKNLLFVLSILVVPVFAVDTVYAPSKASTSIAFEIPFTGGVHRGVATDIQGTLVLDSTNKLVSGRFVVPLTAMKTQNDTRDCHMREALGIDYTNSNFPALHVCNAQNETPATGPDSIAFPNLEFEFTQIAQTTGEALPSLLEEGKSYSVILKGRFSAHGQTKVLDATDLSSTLEATLIKNGESMALHSVFPVVLKDYGIKVKPSHAGPVTISVGEKATVKLNLSLVQN